MQVGFPLIRIEFVEMKQILLNSLGKLCVIHILKISILNISPGMIRVLFWFTVISYNH